MQQELNRKVSTLNAEISSLEAEYIRAQHNMSAEVASLQGYTESSDKIFIHRSDATLVLSSNVDVTN